MERDTEQTPPLVAAPRHLRRRRFREDVPDPLLVPDAVPFALTRAAPSTTERTAKGPSSRESVHGRKRMVALLVVITVSLSIPLLVVVLIFAS